ncbi:hypothetical protein ACLKMY_23645 [Paraburkholderia mimosarum]|uniref:hypothetical protein n=1 Tax=Paraburkholderia mimosarum TaxID=312026 RepID=UPI0039C4CB0C
MKLTQAISIGQSRLLPVVAIAISVALLTFRMTIGVNFTDESYYAAFVDGWLKTGIAGSSDLMAHQTAALWVYPWALIYRALSGGVDGLMFFLRLVYLALATVASLCLFGAVSAYRGQLAATIATVFALWFIPFGLPAPSYNTIGMWSVLAALALFTVPFTRASPGAPTRLPLSLWLSAAWWVVGAVAYPPLVVVPFALVAAAPWVLRDPAERRLLLRYTAACAGLGALTAVVLCVLLQPAHIWQMLRFTNAMNNVSGGMGRKLQFASTLFAGRPRFAAACAAAITIAAIALLCRPKTWISRVADVIVALLIMVVVTAPVPTLYVYSHDLVFVLALAGSGGALRGCFGRDASASDRVFGLIYGTALLGGLVTTATAYYGPYNFAIGGFAAACIAVARRVPRVTLEDHHSRTDGTASRGRSASTGSTGIVTALIACGAMSWAAFSSYYGETALTYANGVSMPRGVYAGLRTDAEKASYAQQMTQALAGLSGCGDRIAVLRGDAGIYLMSKLKPDTVSTWGAIASAGRPVYDMIDAFYRSPAHAPDIVVVDNRDVPWLPPLSDGAKALLANYVLSAQVTAGSYRASIYRLPVCRSNAAG